MSAFIHETFNYLATSETDNNDLIDQVKKVTVDPDTLSEEIRTFCGDLAEEVISTKESRTYKLRI